MRLSLLSRLFLLLIVFVALRSIASPSLVEGRVIKLTRDSEIFEKASGRSKILADVDRDTSVILRKVSPKKNWLLIEDEDRNQGWVPRNRTDFVILQSSQKSAEKTSDENVSSSGIKREEERFDDEPEVNRSLYSWGHAFSLAIRKSLYDINGKWAGGLQYSVLTPLRSNPNQSFRSGFLVGAYRSNSSGYSFPLRYRMLIGGLKSIWSSGPDFGMLFMKSQMGALNVSPGFGYSFQILPFSSSGLFATFRAGLEFRFGTRFSYELGVGYLL